MRPRLAVLTRIRRAALCCGHTRRLSSCAGSGLVVGSSRELVQRLGSKVEVRTAFISEEEEGALLRELEPGLKKKRYEFDHWDDAIHGYRETERLSWGAACEEVLNRVRSVAFPEGSPLLGPVHILDLDKTGYIKPHIDSVKVVCSKPPTGATMDIDASLSAGPYVNIASIFEEAAQPRELIQFCGSTIAGLSLLSDSIMRLVKEGANDEWLDLLLPRHSLYILRDEARYNFTHEILKDEESVFNGKKVPRLRRISVICRNLPS